MTSAGQLREIHAAVEKIPAPGDGFNVSLAVLAREQQAR